MNDSAPPKVMPPSAQPPLETVGPEVSAPGKTAGGVPAIVSTMQHALGAMGVARTLKTLRQVNQKGGFDCPGCAWPDPDGERSHAEFCENGAKAVAEEATLRRVTPEFFARRSVDELARESDYWLGQQGRLAHPMLLRDGATHYEPVSWDDAFALVAEELHALKTPDEAIFYTSGRTSNEAAFLYQLFVRQFGTNNLPDCSNMCHESSGRALTETIGIGKGTVTLEDFNRAQAIFVIGQNPGSNHPRMLTSLQQAKRNGASIVHVNPLPEVGLRRFKHPQEVAGIVGAGTKLADLHLPVRVNGDVAFLKGVMKEILAAPDALAHGFIREQTVGFDDFAAALNEVAWDDITEQSGLARAQIRAAAEVFIASERTIFCWAMGLTQHANAVGNIQEIVNLMLLRGQVGKRGAGLCPVRGHSNVQGDRTMGIWEKPPAAFLDKLEQEFNFAPPRRHGLDTVEAIKAMHAGRAHVFFALGGNFLSATPDTEFTAAALRRCRLTAHVSTKLNRAHLITGCQALILPCLGRTEDDGGQFVTVENSMGVVHSSRGALEPASAHLLSEPAIVARLAKAVLGQDWSAFANDYDLIRERIARVVPGCDDYNAKVRQAGGFYLPNGPREGRFPTPDGKAHFTVHPLPRWDLQPGQLMLMTMRSHDQYNTTIYGLDDRYRGIKNGRRVIFLNPQDIAERGLRAGDWVDVTSHFQGEKRTAARFKVVAYDIPRRCAAAYFPEANALVPINHVAAKSNTPASKSVIVTIKRAAERER
jgi:molybdopterin-dependent oxidoreductase alpha subunit